MSVKGSVASGMLSGTGPLARVPVMTMKEFLQSSARTFISSTGRMSLAVAGNVRVTVANPADSGRNLVISKITGMSTVVAWATLWRNPTSGLPAAVRPHLNGIIHAAEGVAVLKADTSTTTPLDGGVNTGVVFGIPANTRFEILLDPGVLLVPGQVAGINVPFAGAADAVMTLHWGETDV